MHHIKRADHATGPSKGICPPPPQRPQPSQSSAFVGDRPHIGSESFCDYNRPMHGLEGQTVGKYELIRTIGEGSMGTVYLGRDPFALRDVR